LEISFSFIFLSHVCHPTTPGVSLSQISPLSVTRAPLQRHCSRCRLQPLPSIPQIWVYSRCVVFSLGHEPDVMLGFKNQDSSKAASSGATGAILKSDMSKLMSKQWPDVQTRWYPRHFRYQDMSSYEVFMNTWLFDLRFATKLRAPLTSSFNTSAPSEPWYPLVINQTIPIHIVLRGSIDICYHRCSGM
jgi:hypothetical protein